MKKLLEYILENLLPEKDFEVTQADEDNRVILTVKTVPENMGLLIGKEGRTIKALRNILRIRAVLENKTITINTEEK